MKAKDETVELAATDIFRNSHAKMPYLSRIRVKLKPIKIFQKILQHVEILFLPLISLISRLFNSPALN